MERGSPVGVLLPRSVDLYAAILGILLCMACASLNGAMSMAFKTPSFFISLATTGVYHGIALALTGGLI